MSEATSGMSFPFARGCFRYYPSQCVTPRMSLSLIRATALRHSKAAADGRRPNLIADAAKSPRAACEGGGELS
jgi:hypothetical protein